MSETKQETPVETEAEEPSNQMLVDAESEEPEEQTQIEMSPKRRRTPRQITTVAAKAKTAGESSKKVPRKRKQRPLETVKISQYYYDKAVKKIRQHRTKKKRLDQHPMILNHRYSGSQALNHCHVRSVAALNRSLVQPVVYFPTWRFPLKTLRTAILARNWGYCLRLFDAFFKQGSLHRKNLLYLLRMMFFLMFNLNVSNERLSNFLTVTLSMRNPEDQKAYLLSLIKLQKFTQRKPQIPVKNDNSNKKDDPDNVPFEEEDGSSDEDDPDSVPSQEKNDCSDEEDPDDIVPSQEKDGSSDEDDSEDPNDTAPSDENAVSSDDDAASQHTNLSGFA